MFFGRTSFYKSTLPAPAKSANVSAAGTLRPRRRFVPVVADSAGSPPAQGQFLKKAACAVLCFITVLMDSWSMRAVTFFKTAHATVFKFAAAALFVFAFVPLAFCAGEGADAGRVIVFDVAAGGLLGSLVTAAIAYLAHKRTANKRQPPLGEDVARTYATKAELSEVREAVNQVGERVDRSVSGVHRRVDEILVTQNKTNKSLGVLTGILSAKFKCPIPSGDDT